MLKIIEKHQEEYFGFLGKLIEFPSYPCKEGDIAKFILSELQKLPIDEAFIDECGNVVGIIRGTGEGPNILLNGHMDIVPEGNVEKWAPFNPFKLEIKDGFAYGRGVCDMKGGLAAMFYAFKAVAEYLQETGGKLSGDLVYSGVVQEEPAEMFGMEYFMEETMPKHDIKADVVYISEPSMGKFGIAQRGKIELVVKTYGKCAHSSAPEEGINALEHMTEVLDLIFKKEGFKMLVDAKGPAGLTVTNIIVKPGGTLSCIPDECEIAVDRRYTPAQSEEELLAEFYAIFDKMKEKYPDFQATVEPRYFDETSWTGVNKKIKKWHPSWAIDENNPFVQKTFEAMSEVGLPAEAWYFPGGTDASMSCGIKGVPSIIYCDVEIAPCHKEPEYTPVQGLLNTYEGYVAILAKNYGIDVKEFDK